MKDENQQSYGVNNSCDTNKKTYKLRWKLINYINYSAKSALQQHKTNKVNYIIET